MNFFNNILILSLIVILFYTFWWVPFAIPMWLNDYYNEDANAMYAPLEYEYCYCNNFTVIDKRHDMFTSVHIPRSNDWVLNGNDNLWYRSDSGIMYDKMNYPTLADGVSCEYTKSS